VPETNASDDAKIAVFLDGLAEILADLDKISTSDPETTMLIGSLADRLCTDAGKDTWPEVKASLDDAERQSLVDTLAREIADSGKKRQIKTAYAMQAIAASLVGSRLADQRVSAGVALLDDFIAASRDFFQRNRPAAN